MMIVEKLRDEKRARNETKPRRNSENLTEDWVYIAGMIGAFNAVLKLPKDAQDFIKKLPDTGEPK